MAALCRRRPQVDAGGWPSLPNERDTAVKPLSFASRRFSVLFMAMMFSSVVAIAGQTGKIAGHLTDAQTREPLIGVNVIIDGTRLGAATNEEGYYFINNVPPGTYTLRVSAVGYQRAVIRNVQVSIDLTTTIDVKLSSTAIEAGEIVITAERPLVQKDLTSTSVTVSSDELKMMPVENFDQVINLQAGVVAGHFRGGRSDEVLYLVDGVSVTDPYNNGRGFTVENSSIRQMEVISGAFNAEYGQAMSGVVNIVTQEGASALHGSLSGYVGDFFTSHPGTFQYLDFTKGASPRTRDVEATIGGPTMILDGLTFFATGRYLDQKGYLYGVRMFQTTDNNPYAPTGNGEPVPMNPSRRWSASGKLAYAFENMKLFASSNLEYGRNKYYDHSYRWVPDGVMTHYHTSQMHNLQFTHAVTPSTFYTMKYTYNFFDYRGYLYADPFDPRYVDPDRGDPQSNYTFRSGGNYSNRYERNTMMNLLQWSLTSQVTKEHKIGAGVEGQFIRMYSHGYNFVNFTAGVYDSATGLPVFTLGYPRLGAIGNQAYLKKPMQLAAYIQDKMEYDIMIINAGVRFDYFSPASEYPADLKNPTGNTLFPGAGVTRKATKKWQISPRVGVSFPITDQGIIHFSYGHFFQIPGYDNLYTNSDYLVSSAGTLSTITGNPDLNAQRTVSYEIGLQQVLFEIFSLDLTAYYRDIRNYLGMEIVETYDGRSYARYINRDYANVRGFVVALDKRFMDYFGLRADYTFQIAEGNSSDPRTVYLNNQSDPPTETPKSVVPLDWDQRNTLNLTFMVGKPNDWVASMIFQYGSGTPYTEDVRTSQGIRFENGGTKPSFFNVDLRAEKSIPLEGVNLNAFLWVYNIFDIKNEVNVNSTSGRANIDIFTSLGGRIIGLNSLEQYLNDPTSFSSPREVRFGLSLDF
jgi:outer membrane receptor protein involved in Fe transport